MGIDTPPAIPIKVHTTEDGRTFIEQSASTIVLHSAAEILAIISELHACYDYCAAWKEPAAARNGAGNPEGQRE